MNIENKHLSLRFSEKFATYELQSKQIPGAKLRGYFEILCRCEGKDYQLIEDFWSISKIEQNKKLETRFGVLEIENLKIKTKLKDVDINFRIGLAKDQAMAFIQIELVNNCNEPLYVDQIIPVIIKAGDLTLGSSLPQDRSFYSNGWQSWSKTGTYFPGDKQNTTLIGKFQNPQIRNPSTPSPKDGKHFSGDMYGLICDNRNHVGLLAGFLSQKSHFGSLETALQPDLTLKMWANGDKALLKPGQKIETDWASLSFTALDALEPMAAYMDVVTAEHEIRSKSPVPVGWCSWYHFYQDIDQKNIDANLDSVLEIKEEVPLPLFQIDDGFETFPGDWFDFVPGFPDGVAPLAKKARDAGLTPGLWLAPFIVHPKAKLVEDHPDWLLRDHQGKLVSAGFVWNTFTYALDITHPEALDYASNVISTAVKDWGFEYLKLDFLYAAALKGQYRDPTQTRAQVLRKGLEALRAAAGPRVFMLACGCPLGTALGLFDAMRIGADVSGYWEPHFPPVSRILNNEVNMPSARNALQNILTRTHCHRRWWINDPDCLLVRPDTALTINEVQTLATAIALTGGSLLVSDDLPALPEDRLQIIQKLVPLIDQRAYILDLFHSQTPRIIRLDLENALGLWYLLAFFNWKDQAERVEFFPQRFKIPGDHAYWWREFWSGESGQLAAASPLVFENVPPHGVRVIAVRPLHPNQPAYLGGDLHFSQGLEVSDWQAADKQISLRFELGRRADGSSDIYLPWEPTEVRLNALPCPIKSQGHGIYNIELHDADGKWLNILG